MQFRFFRSQIFSWGKILTLISKDDKLKGSIYGSVPSKSSKLLLVLEPPNNWGSFVSHVEAGGISVVLLGSWPLRSLRSLCGMGPKGASEKNRLSDTRPNYFFLPSHHYYYCTGKKKKKNGTPSFSSYLLTIVFLLLQHGWLINEKILQYEIEVPTMDGLSKTFLFFIQILMTLMKLGDINVE